MFFWIFRQKDTLKLFGTKRNYNKTFLPNECRRSIYTLKFIRAIFENNMQTIHVELATHRHGTDLNPKRKTLLGIIHYYHDDNNRKDSTPQFNNCT